MRRFGNELILLGQMHKQRGMKAVEFAQIFLGVTAVIGDCSVGAVTHGRQEAHQAAEAVAEDRNLTAAIGQFSHNVNGVLNVPGARIPVIGLIKTKAVLPVRIGSDAKVDSRLLAPETLRTPPMFWPSCLNARAKWPSSAIASVG